VGVTRRKRHHESVPVGQKAVTMQGGGACPAAAKRKRGRTFCRPGTSFLSYTRVALQGLSEAGNKSRYAKFYCGHWCGRCISYYKSVMGAGVKVEECSDEIPLRWGKNRDKPIKHTVRVRRRSNFKTVMVAVNCLGLCCLCKKSELLSSVFF
jgi:hypothetical protein